MCIVVQQKQTFNMINKKKSQKGFTLIEMMVSVSIFAIVVMISMGAIFTVVDSNKKAQSLKSVMNNLNFALETMTRTIKTGQMQSFTSGGNTISTQIFDPTISNVTYTYRTDASGVGYVELSRDGVVSRITAPEVNITNLKFYGVKPMVVMVVQGTVKLDERISSDFNIQTTVTQRLPNN